MNLTSVSVQLGDTVALKPKILPTKKLAILLSKLRRPESQLWFNLMRKNW